MISHTETKDKRQIYQWLAGAAVCFVLFILGKVLLPRLAGDLRSPRQKAADRREFNLELFTLRVIDEEELKYRLTKD